MTKTIREWIEFLQMGDNHYIGIRKEGGHPFKIKDYILASECFEYFDGWLDEIATTVRVCNLCYEGKYYHLIMYK